MTTVEQATDRYRTDMLTGIAKRWDTTIFDADDRGADTHFIQQSLARASAEYAHPLLALADIQALMETLRDAVNAKKAYLDDGTAPIPDENLAAYSHDMLVAILDRDIDDALWPLLTGLSTVWACRECQRRKAHVWDWQPHVQGARRCAQHNLAVAR